MTARSGAVHVLVFDGLADWEPAYALAELRRSGHRQIRTVGFSREAVESMGGIRILPESVLGSVQPADVELLILPGGDLWETGTYPRSEVEGLIHRLLEIGKPVAAICGATIALARAGVLNDRRHTANMRSDLADRVSEYSGGEYYLDAPVACDRHVITASGLGAVDFARAIFAELGIFSPSDEQLWFDMFKHGRLPEATA